MILWSYYVHACLVGVCMSIASYFPSLHFSTTTPRAVTDKSLADVGREGEKGLRKKHSGGLNHAMNESMGGAAYLRNGVRRRRGGCTGVVLCGGSSGWVGGVTSPDIFLGCSNAVE